ncbi:MAG: glycosyltransferase, partial [Bacteroidales bacterium]|nr:glycosyltransferase [Bacteroidales bacterium]
MTKRIIMAVTNDLLTDQRVDRSCRTLQEAGYEVTLVGRRLPKSGALEKRGYRCVRMRLLFRRSAWFYAEYNLRLLLRLLVMPADAFFANDSDTLLACCWAARLRHKRLLFDAHELFPDVPELVGKPRVQKVWKLVERHSLPRVDVAFTVSQSVAEEYRRRYGVEMTVVRNLPEREHLEPMNSNAMPRRQGEPYVLIYQGAVNVGRGVRELIDVMRLLPQCRLAVIGDGDLLEELRAYTATLPWAN